jgi:hypothetical protein
VIHDNADRYHAQPAEAFHKPETLASDFRINDSQPAPSADFTAGASARRKRRANRGSFRPGHDSRRHKFTPAECSRGFWTAIAVMGLGIGAKLHKAGRWPGYRRAAR